MEVRASRCGGEGVRDGPGNDADEGDGGIDVFEAGGKLNGDGVRSSGTDSRGTALASGDIGE